MPTKPSHRVVSPRNMDKQDLDLLLQARTSELQHEYENLVRSLDAAYEAVKAIGRDIADNRAEARRLFDTRLKLARGDDLEAVLRLCSVSNNSNSDANVANNIQQQSVVSKANVVNGRKQSEPVRLYVQQISDAEAAQNTIHPPSRVVALGTATAGSNAAATVATTVAVNGNESMPKLRPIIKPQTIQPYDAATLLIEQIQQQHRQHKQQHSQQPHYTPVYVGDDHSYAVADDEEEDVPEHQLMLEERLMVDTGDAKRRRYRDSHASGVDLSIVKSEAMENVSIEEHNPTVENNVAKPVAIVKSRRITVTSPRKTNPKRIRAIELSALEELNRKRKQTRERMRRWRAKKKEEGGNNKQPIKYKVLIAKSVPA